MFQVELGLIIWTTVSFSILVMLLYKFLLPPIIEVLDRREMQIKSALDNAALESEKAAKLAADYAARLERAHRDASAVVQRSKDESEALLEEARKRARTEAENITEQAMLSMNSEKERLLSEIKENAADLIIAAASKVLEKQISREDNLEIIKESLKDAEPV